MYAAFFCKSHEILDQTLPSLSSTGFPCERLCEMHIPPPSLTLPTNFLCFITDAYGVDNAAAQEERMATSPNLWQGSAFRNR